VRQRQFVDPGGQHAGLDPHRQVPRVDFEDAVHAGGDHHDRVGQGTVPPLRLVPEPRGTTLNPEAPASFSTPATWAADCTEHDRLGRLVEHGRAIVPVHVPLFGRGQHIVFADQFAELRQCGLAGFIRRVPQLFQQYLRPHESEPPSSYPRR